MRTKLGEEVRLHAPRSALTAPGSLATRATSGRTGAPEARLGRIATGLAVLVILACSAASAQTYRADSTGRIIAVVEGARDRLEAATRALESAWREQGALEAPSVLFDVPAMEGDDCPDPAALGLTSTQLRRVIRVPLGRAAAARAARSPGSAWDEAYDRLIRRGGWPEAQLLYLLRDNGVRVVAIEPDLIFYDQDPSRALESATPAMPMPPDTHAAADGVDEDWPVPNQPGWHLCRSGLDEARELVEKRLTEQEMERVTIAHFDTGYMECSDAGLPPRLDREASWDFTRSVCDGGPCVPSPGAVDGEPTNRLHSHGHGTGTLGVLAGGPVSVSPDHAPPFSGPLGGAPFARVVEYRLFESVLVWQPSVMAQGLRWAASHEADVVSMSMGGPPGFAMHGAVNAAYCSGVAVFAAAGNHLANPLLPASTPRTTVYPARHHRVVSVVGATADRLTYAKSPWRWRYLWKPWQRVMRGNSGPSWVMKEALAAWTPNVPWLVFRSDDDCNCSPPSIRFNGSGTSAATPQVAAAAAAWLQYYRNEFDPREWRSWQKVEAVYRALFDSARRDMPSESYSEEWFGNGTVRAAKALRGGVPSGLTVRRRAHLDTLWVGAAILSMIGGSESRERSLDEALENMFSTEIAQLAIVSPELGERLQGANADGTNVGAGLRDDIIEAVAKEERASKTLRENARKALEKNR